MILTHGANSLAGGDDFVEIGGRKYPVVKIGNQEWLAENLDYKWTGLDIGPSGSPSTQAAWYYDNDEATYGIDGTYKCGLLYNWYAAKYLNDNKATLLPDGWRVPAESDYVTLKNTIGGTSNEVGTKLKALDNSVISGFPSGWNGTDDYGFKLLPSGFYVNGESFYRLGTEAYELTTNASGNNAIFINILANSASFQSQNYKYHGYSIRLVSLNYGKVNIGGRDYKTIKIGNQEWLAENLKYDTSAFFYPNGDSSNADEGYLYQYKVVYDEIIPILPDGWHVPSKSDWDTLKGEVPSSRDWISEDFGGTNASGLNIPLSGYREHPTATFVEYGVNAALWSSTPNSTASMKNLLLSISSIDTNDTTSGSPSELTVSANSLRLVKDAP